MNGFGILGGASTATAQSFVEHSREWGAVPDTGRDFVDVLELSGLRGRGGGAFPTATKWAAVAERASRRPVVLVNGAEGEPASGKDRLLMTVRPHLIIDGAIIAAHTVGASDVVFYVGGEHLGALASMRRAIAERPATEQRTMALIAAPPGYVAGEETAAVHFINDGVALPLSTPPRPFERGVRGRPTLVHNVETLAHVALIARFGSEWFRTAGEAGAAGTVLLTVGGSVRHPGVIEVPHGVSVAGAVQRAGGLTADSDAVLIGGYFGTWHDARTAWTVRLDASALRRQGHTLGCGVVHALPARTCGVTTSAQVLAFLANESAQQCGPCVFGLRAMAETLDRVAASRGGVADLQRLLRWAGLVTGRGACRHPDGAAQFLRSALTVFADDFESHARGRGCLAAGRLAEAS